MLRRLSWILPGGPVLLAAAFAHAFAPSSFLVRSGVGYPWVAYGAALLLAWLFRRSRVAVATLALAAFHLVLGGVPALYVAPLAGIAFALVLVGLSAGVDRGVLSSGGLGQLAGAAGVGVVVALVGRADPPLVVHALAATPLPAILFAWTGLPQLVLFTLVLAAGSLAWAAWRRGGVVEKGLLWTVPAIAVALAQPTAPALFLLAAAVILALSVVEVSYAMAYRDDLTGLPARRALQRDLAALGGAYTLAMVDVDHFKKFNDRHGHAVGDQVLRMVATRLSRTPGGAKAYRYGGEEFTLLFRGLSREQAMPHLEAVRADVAEARFALRSWRRPREKPAEGKGDEGRGRRRTHPPKELSVTVSLGAADSRGADPDPTAVLKRADRALYRAKSGGRNRVSK